MDTISVEMTEETKKKLKTFAPIDVDAEWDYTPEAYKASGLSQEKRPVFRLREPSGEKLAELEDQAGRVLREDGQVHYQLKLGTHRISMLKYCVIGWKNYGKEYVDASSIKLLPPALQHDLKEEIERHMTLNGEEKRGLE